MMGIWFDFPTYIYGNNQSLLENSTRPYSLLNNKSSWIAYCFGWEGVSKYEWISTYICTHDNVAYMVANPLYNGIKGVKFMNVKLHHITLFNGDYVWPHLNSIVYIRFLYFPRWLIHFKLILHRTIQFLYKFDSRGVFECDK